MVVVVVVVVARAKPNLKKVPVTRWGNAVAICLQVVLGLAVMTWLCWKGWLNYPTAIWLLTSAWSAKRACQTINYRRRVSHSFPVTWYATHPHTLLKWPCTDPRRNTPASAGGVMAKLVYLFNKFTVAWDTQVSRHEQSCRIQLQDRYQGRKQHLQIP